MKFGAIFLEAQFKSRACWADVAGLGWLICGECGSAFFVYKDIRSGGADQKDQ